MRAEPEITILARGIVDESDLPRRWKKRAGFADLAGLDDTALLARAFGIEAAGLADAPLHYLGVKGSDPGGYCLCAYPVYLHPRREQLILMSGPEFELREAEARGLMATIQEHFPHWRIERAPDAMWFIIVDAAPDLRTTPLREVLGEDINDHLPRGGDGMEWVRILNELQMILFDAEVNRKREAAGEPTLNSLWLWGGGRLPEIPPLGWRRVMTNDPVARGIGCRAGVETLWLDDAPARFEAGEMNVAAGGTVWIYSGARRPGEQKRVLSKAQWQALRRALKHGEIGRLVLIDPDYGELVIAPRRAGGWLPWR